MSTAAIAVSLLLMVALLTLAMLTAAGARRRGRPWHIVLVSGMFFPATWTIWYVLDERPFSRLRRLPTRSH